MEDGTPAIILQVTPESNSFDAHHLPCGVVNFSGEVNANSYFRPKPYQTHSDEISGKGNSKGCDAKDCELREVSLRGRRLIGEKVSFGTDEYSAVVLQRPRDDATKSKCFKMTNSVSNVYRYNHDVMPSSIDPMSRCLQWVALSHCSGLHTAVSEKEVDDAIKRLAFE